MGILNEPQEIEEQEKCECGCEEVLRHHALS